MDDVGAADQKTYTLGTAPPVWGDKRATNNTAKVDRAKALPKPTQDLDQALKDIAEFGLCIIENALTPGQLDRARTAFYHAAAEDRLRGRESKFGLDYADDDSNQRVWNLLGRDPIFIDLVEHPMALGLVKAMLGWPALLGNISGNLTGPGGGEMVLHADQIFVPTPWPDEPQGFNCAWCLDDFTEENGATRIVPGSHKFHKPPTDADQDTQTLPLEATAGSMIAFESRLWHKTGNNHTKAERRAGAFAWYTKPIYRTQENWFLSLKPEVRQFASDDALMLLGYRTAGFGLVNGASPA